MIHVHVVQYMHSIHVHVLLHVPYCSFSNTNPSTVHVLYIYMYVMRKFTCTVCVEFYFKTFNIYIIEENYVQ